MPIISNSSYKKPSILFNRHLETILPSLIRWPKKTPKYVRERLDTPDGDFLDLDWGKQSSSKLVIISHGLEGSSDRSYVLGMGHAFYNENWDVLAWNYRGCSGEINRTNQFYHSGATHDLEFVIGHAVDLGYQEITLVGFSLGGNLTLKYLGESTTKKFDEVKKGCVFSVPIDLEGCSLEIDKPHNKLYSRRFLKSLNEKVKSKKETNSTIKEINEYKNAKSVFEFDDMITAPIHGFENAKDYYEKSSARKYIAGIKVPTLVVNALNDPFLSPSCYESLFFEASQYVFFETPSHGGHVGFSAYNSEGIYWSEKRALEWVLNDKTS